MKQKDIFQKTPNQTKNKTQKKLKVYDIFYCIKLSK